MEIVTQQLGDALEVKVKGRLDNYWTEHLRGNLEEVIRGGAHGIRLNSIRDFLSQFGRCRFAGEVSHPTEGHRRKFHCHQPFGASEAGVGSLPAFDHPARPDDIRSRRPRYTRPKYATFHLQPDRSKSWSVLRESR